MTISIRDLAAACGLSVSTVSKALNGYPDVSEKTREQVRQAAESLGYHPSAIARSIKTGRSFNLGVLYSDDTESGFTHNYFGPVLQAFKQEAERSGYDITFISKGQQGMSYLQHCSFRSLDGVCIVCTHFQDPEVQELLSGPLPVVTVDYAFEGHTCVRSQNREGMKMLTRYVISRGHRKIACIAGDSVDISGIRVAAFREAMSEAGIPVREDYLAPGRYHDPATARRVTRRILALPDPPTCILMPDDTAALGGMDAIRAAGLRIPEDISIAGFDGVPILQMCKPRLTTVRQDTQAIGSGAARRLIAHIEAPESSLPEILSVPCTLLEGETVSETAQPT